MYGEFFNIDESAFSIAPNPKYLYLSAQHQEVLAHLLYGITRSGGFVLITGEIGTGKTTVCRSLFAEIPENTDIALIVNPKLDSVDLLASICDELDITYPDVPLGAKTFLNKLNERLIESHAQGRNTILIIDEAQNLSNDSLETIRGLTNLETDEQKLLQIILIGQPELRDRLDMHAMEQLNQRVTARFHLQALDKNEVASYIQHRLKVGNADQSIFSKSNIDYIFKLTGGVPRLINVLCDRALLGAYVQKKKKISNDIIYNAASESLGKRKQRKKTSSQFSSKKLTWLAVILLVAATLGIIFYDSSKDSKEIESPISDLAENKVIPSVSNQVTINKGSEDIAVNKDSNLEGVAGLDIDKESKQAEELSISSALNADDDEVATEYLDEQVALDQSSIGQESESGKLTDELLRNLTEQQWAYHNLLTRWGLHNFEFDASPCAYARSHGLQCFSGEGTVSLLQRLNRPVVLENKLPNGDIKYLFVTKVVRGEVTVLDRHGQYKVAWSDVNESWQGKFHMLWKPLTDKEFIRPGDSGAFVKDIDTQLSIIFNRSPQWEEINIYDRDLVREVTAFQRTQKLQADGIIGPLTQIFMNNIVRSDLPSLR
jgi:general secretion pathway protein A